MGSVLGETLDLSPGGRAKSAYSAKSQCSKSTGRRSSPSETVATSRGILKNEMVRSSPSLLLFNASSHLVLSSRSVIGVASY